MKSENMYIVWAHPRADSLTAQMVQEIQKQATHHGINVSVLDLYRSGFNPLLGVEDEPDWSNPDKRYPAEVHRLFGELKGKDTIMIVFPLWWYSFPAMIKGYLERVWNFGLAYGGQEFPAKRVCWLALVGGSEARFEKYGWKKNMTEYLQGAGSYLGIEESHVDFLFNTIGVEEDITDRESHYQGLFKQAREKVDALVR